MDLNEVLKKVGEPDGVGEDETLYIGEIFDNFKRTDTWKLFKEIITHTKVNMIRGGLGEGKSAENILGLLTGLETAVDIVENYVIISKEIIEKKKVEEKERQEAVDNGEVPEEIKE